MSYPGRVGAVCGSCGAELQEIAGDLRCPWATSGRDCRRPYGRVDSDQAQGYVRDQLRRKGYRP